MKIGVNTFIWSAAFGRTELDLLPAIKAHGFDGIEVPLFDPAAFPAAEIRRAAAAQGLEVTVCSIVPRGLSLITDDADLRRKTQAHVRAAIERTAEVGATLMGGPLYAPVGDLRGRRRTRDEWKHAVESYQSLTAALEQFNVTLGIEPLNRFETYFVNTAADVTQLCADVDHPRVGVVYDTFHANIEEKDVAESCRAIGRHLAHVQISENDRGTPGSGHTDWRGLIQVLRDLRYDAWLTIESFGANLGDFSSAVCIWRDIEPTPEAIAFDGAAFLRRLIAG